MCGKRLKIGKVYFFDARKNTKGIFLFKKKLLNDYSYYFVPIGDPGGYIMSGMYKGLVGFNSSEDFVECEIKELKYEINTRT